MQTYGEQTTTTGESDMSESHSRNDLHAEITELEVELERVLALAAVSQQERAALRERLRKLKTTAGL
jgi:ElaB/YqjD/DUF883 family membrane-anchored ribosome-binding protein